MKVYIGQTRARWLTAELAALGYGECTNRGELPPRRYPWFFDNGAFADWKADRPWDEQAYTEDIQELIRRPLVTPDFLVAPDIVAGGVKSLDLSREWLPRLRAIGPVYVAVQNGMAIDPATIEGFDGIFVGGDLEWKLLTGGGWVRLGFAQGVPVHVGRVGTGKRVQWARDIGAASIDSALPLWSRANLRRFRVAHDQRQFNIPGTIRDNDSEVTEQMVYDYRHHARRMHALSKTIDKRRRKEEQHQDTTRVKEIDARMET